MRLILLSLLVLLTHLWGTEEPSFHWEYALVTAYADCEQCCYPLTHITGDGRHIAGRYVRGVAADPRAIPYHTTIEVPGYGVTVVDDTGSAMRRDWRHHHIIHIDLRLPTFDDAVDYGVKHLWIKVFDSP
jgi:3D (Asp-Asp-Asp) domain-containing protein